MRIKNENSPAQIRQIAARNPQSELQCGNDLNFNIFALFSKYILYIYQIPEGWRRDFSQIIADIKIFDESLLYTFVQYTRKTDYSPLHTLNIFTTQPLYFQNFEFDLSAVK